MNPFRWNIGAMVRPVMESINDDKTTRNLEATDIGRVVSLTLDARGTYAAVQFPHCRLLVHESHITSAGAGS